MAVCAGEYHKAVQLELVVMAVRQQLWKCVQGNTWSCLASDDSRWLERPSMLWYGVDHDLVLRLVARAAISLSTDGGCWTLVGAG